MSDLPRAPVPPDCDLTGLAFMPLEVKRLASSDLASQETPEACWAAVLLWCESWQQVPAASLTDNDSALARAAGYGRDLKRWAKVRAGALRGWQKCDDGRLYHPVVAEKALEAWLERLAQRLSSGEGNAKRWGLAFDKSKIDAAMEDARQRLAALNPDSRTLTKRRTARIAEGYERESQGDSRRDSHRDSQGDSRRDRKGQGQGQGQGHSTDIPPPSPASDARDPAATTARPVRVQGYDHGQARQAIQAGDLHALARSFGARAEGDRRAEWTRDAAGMTLHGVAAVLWWCARGKGRTPIREPSGFRAALADWRALDRSAREDFAAWAMDDLGIASPPSVPGKPGNDPEAMPSQAQGQVVAV
jgi:hypothetical protein